MNNDIGSLLVPLVPFDNFDAALPSIQKVYNRLKSSLMPFGVLMSTQISMWFPFLIPKLLLDDLTGKYSIVYSNLNASRKGYEFNGKKMIGHYFLTPGFGQLHNGISILTIGDRMSLGIYTDEALMQDPQELVDIISEHARKAVGE